MINGRRGRKSGEYSHPALGQTLWLDRESICWDYFGGTWRNLESPMERGEGDHFETVILQNVSGVSRLINICD